MMIQMNYEEFQAYYPMPDDVAQSILISETETNIHLRPTHANSKRLWLYNKLLKNLLTKRKTIIYLTQASDYSLLEEFLIEHNLQKLAFTFTHSRSNNEKNLLEFTPIIVNGSLKTKNLEFAINNLYLKHNDYHKAIWSIYKKTNSSNQNFSTLLSQSLELRQSLKTYSNLLPDTELLSAKDLLQIKILLPEAIQYIKIKNNFLEPFTYIHEKAFDLFTVEESWSAITHHIQDCKNKIIDLLHYQNAVKAEFYKDHLSKIESELLHPFEFIISSTIRENLNLEEDLNLKLQLSEFSNKLEVLCPNTKVDNVKSIVELEQLYKIIQNEVDCQWITEKNEVTNNVSSKYIKTILKETEEFFNWLNTKSILHSNYAHYDSIHKNEEVLRSLLFQLNAITQLADFYPAYFQWKQFTRNIPRQQLILIQKLYHIPSQYWEAVIHLLLIEKQIQNIDQTYIFKLKTLEKEFYESLEKYKSEILPYISYQFEKLQHKAIENLIITDQNLYSIFKFHRASDANLSEQYVFLPQLSEIFPIIILDNIKTDYLVPHEGKVWDEVIYMDENPSHNNIDKLKAACHRLIHVNESQNSSSIFNIAMMQAFPEGLVSLFYTQSVIPFQKLNQLNQYIFNNIDHFDTWLNSKEFVISFLPQEWNEILKKSLMSDYNYFKISGDSGFERILNCLSFQVTKKKVFILDNLYSQEGLNIQQLAWQRYFIKSLNKVGFEIVNFELEKFLELRFVWNKYFNSDLYSPLRKTTLASINME